MNPCDAQYLYPFIENGWDRQTKMEEMIVVAPSKERDSIYLLNACYNMQNPFLPTSTHIILYNPHKSTENVHYYSC